MLGNRSLRVCENTGRQSRLCAPSLTDTQTSHTSICCPPLQHRAAKASANYPCRQGDGEKCWNIGKWRACHAYPKISSCTADADMRLPNQFIPWVRKHAGVKPMLLKIMSLLKPSYRLKVDRKGLC